MNQSIQNKNKTIDFFVARIEQLKEALKCVGNREIVEGTECKETSGESFEKTQQKFQSVLESSEDSFKITRFDYEMFLIDNPDLVSITEPISKLVEYEFQHYGTKGENESNELYRSIWSFLCGKNHDLDKDIHHLDHDSSNTFFRNLVLIPSELHQQLHSVTKEIAASQHNINEILSGADSEILNFKDEILGVYKLSSEDAIKKHK